MTLAEHLRIGSLEITAILACAAVLAAIPRRGGAAEIAGMLPVRALLKIFEVGMAPRAFEGLVPLTLGRDVGCDLVFADGEVSRRHARLESQNGVVFLRDLDSSNGTFLNGKRLKGTVETLPGDEIDLGTSRVLVEGLAPWT
jgi:hypothetical protein